MDQNLPVIIIELCIILPLACSASFHPAFVSGHLISRLVAAAGESLCPRYAAGFESLQDGGGHRSASEQCTPVLQGSVHAESAGMRGSGPGKLTIASVLRWNRIPGSDHFQLTRGWILTPNRKALGFPLPGDLCLFARQSKWSPGCVPMRPSACAERETAAITKNEKTCRPVS